MGTPLSKLETSGHQSTIAVLSGLAGTDRLDSRPISDRTGQAFEPGFHCFVWSSDNLNAYSA
jgi:hypothetical protein